MMVMFFSGKLIPDRATRPINRYDPPTSNQEADAAISG